MKNRQPAVIETAGNFMRQRITNVTNIRVRFIVQLLPHTVFIGLEENL